MHVKANIEQNSSQNMIYFMNTNQNVETAKTAWALFTNVESSVESTGGREGWSRGWVSGIRGEKRDGKHSRNLCMGAYYMIAESLLTYCEDLLYRVSPKSSWIYMKSPTRLNLISVSSFEIPQIFLFSITLLPSSPFSVICRINSETGLRAKTWFYFPSVCLEGEGWVQRWWRPWLQRPPWLQSLRVQAATQAGL